VSLFGRQKPNREGASGVPSAAPEAGPRGAASQSQRPVVRDRSHANGGKQVANIGKSITIKGDLTGKEDLVIEGTVEGRVELPDAQLTVGANGSVQAEVHAKSVVVIGKVTGNIHGSERIEIQNTGHVKGDVIAPKLIVAEGAVLNGAIQMTGAGSAAGARPSSAAAGSEVRRVS